MQRLYLLKLLEKIEELVYLVECENGLRVPPINYPDAKPEDCLPQFTSNGYGSPAKKWILNQIVINI